MNLAQLLSTSARERPEGVAIWFAGSSITFEALEARARRVAAGLSTAGVERGDRVALWLGNHPDFAALMYGSWRVGAVVVPVHYGLTGPEAKQILDDASPKLTFCGKDQAERAKDATSQRVVELDDIEAFLGASGEAAEPVDAGTDDLALIGYTAGTSGVPKGAMLTHGNLRSNLDQMQASPIAIGPEDVVLCVLPLFHIFGLNVVLNLSVAVGAKIVLLERFDVASSLAAIGEHVVTVVAGAPPVYLAWLADPDAAPDAFSNIRVAVSGAAPLSRDVLHAFRERFDVTIWEGYGLTETSPALTFAGMGGVAKPGSVGRPLPGVELRLVDEPGEDAEEGDPGEIVVRGPNVFQGYWSAPEETQAVFLPDGWFRTGDIAVVDDDGDLFIVDRRRDMVIVSGFNVYPREVEDVLRSHPKVLDVAVVGTDDPQTGEAVRAIVVPDGAEGGLSEDELADHCRRSLASYKIPAHIEFAPEIPRNAAGKVLRRALRS